ncbi:hypothetical protein PBRA_009536 [Plasmodiophora brassicae]|uniref:Uncharacterized protein n=1 Tax=Plasmodiophora brassicae TaxID=37360 RepID=A0A0G4J952_PLABS|nr:hypothetical protein PBRA_009536 [Plasmodiophora brassicae]
MLMVQTERRLKRQRSRAQEIFVDAGRMIEPDTTDGEDHLFTFLQVIRERLSPHKHSSVLQDKALADMLCSSVISVVKHPERLHHLRRRST